MSPLSPVKEQHTPAPSKVTGDRYLTALHSSRNDTRKLLVVLQTHVSPLVSATLTFGPAYARNHIGEVKGIPTRCRSDGISIEKLTSLSHSPSTLFDAYLKPELTAPAALLPWPE